MHTTIISIVGIVRIDIPSNTQNSLKANKNGVLECMPFLFNVCYFFTKYPLHYLHIPNICCTFAAVSEIRYSNTALTQD